MSDARPAGAAEAADAADPAEAADGPGTLDRLLRWAQGHHRRGVYSPLGVAFHWTMAALIVFQLGFGWYVGRLPSGGDKHLGYQLHGSVGFAVLVLGMLRLAWRGHVGTPRTVSKDSFAGRASHVIQVLFYLAFAVLPLSGWVMTSALPGDLQFSIAGLVPVPPLPFDPLSEPLRFTLLETAEGVHQFCVWALLLMIPGHAGAAIAHYLVKRDRVLPSMLDLNGPERPGLAGPAPAMPAAAEPRVH